MQQTFQQHKNSNEKATSSASFSPYLAKSLEVEATRSFPISFSPRHNMIIVCSLINDMMRFYDADTLLPIKGRETLKLDSSGELLSYHLETDTYLVKCRKDSIYLYHASNHKLKRLRPRADLAAATFLNSTSYIFSAVDYYKLFLGTFGKNTMILSESQGRFTCSLQHLAESNLLLSGLDDGSMMIYRTDKLPRLPVFCSVQANQDQDAVITVQSINVNGKEYILTVSDYDGVKIWHMIKGKIRLLKVIESKESLFSVVYLENYKMIAMTSGTNMVKFFSFPSGKFEGTVSLKRTKAAHGLFQMKEKNMIGVTSEERGSNIIEFIQLSN